MEPSRDQSPVANRATRASRERVRSLQPARSTVVGEITAPVQKPQSEQSPKRRRRRPRAASRPTSNGVPEWCAIAVARRARAYEFEVVAAEKGGARRVVARSREFRMPLWCRGLGWRRLPRIGKPRRAHDTVVTRLLTSGWQRIETRGRWHDTAFVRSTPDLRRGPLQRMVVGCERDGSTGRFYAEELDAFGNVLSVEQSPPFAVNPWSLRVSPTDEARAAHDEFLTHLCFTGWMAPQADRDAQVGHRAWYARVLERRAG